jgi:hypothetical protein
MIEFVTWPSNLAERSAEEDRRFYLELYGEIQPEVDERYVEVLSMAEEHQGLKEGARLAPLYEYCWNLGCLDDDDMEHATEGWGDLADTAAEVYLYFPTAGGWRVEELVATVKYLCPAREHTSLLQEAAHMFATAQPIIEDVSKLASASSALAPGIGPAATGTAALLDTIAKLKLTSVPPAEGYDWSVQKVARYLGGEGLVSGVRWVLPKKVFIEFGTRLTGSIALSIVPSKLQSLTDNGEPQSLERLPVRAKAIIHEHAVMPGRGKSVSLPPKRGFLELQVHPKKAMAASAVRSP